jgi:glycosyltransferase involved in cell wall biosynthesis
MRIVHVSVGGTPVLHRFGGAIQRRVIETAVRQAARGDEVIVYSPGAADERRAYRGAEIRFLACKRKGTLGWIELQRRVVRDLAGEAVDVLHFHSQPEGAVLSRKIAAKKVLSYDYFLFRRGRKTPLFPLYRRFLRAFDAHLPVSEYCRDESQAYWHLPAEKMRVLPNGVSMEQFQPDPALARAEREAHGITKRVVLYVGRVCEQKGTDLLIDACQALNARRDDVQLVVAGPIGQFGRTEDSEGWAERIARAGGVYLGPVAEEKLRATYNMADIFVMPTRVHEMFGMAAVEAQACGKPVVASDHGGLIETVPTDCGARVPVGDATAVATGIERLLDDPAAYERAATNALRNAARYDWERVVDDLDAIYRETPATHTRRPAPATSAPAHSIRT